MFIPFFTDLTAEKKKKKKKSSEEKDESIIESVEEIQTATAETEEKLPELPTTGICENYLYINTINL